MNKIDAAGETDNVGGVTVRDLFAAHALTGLLAFSPEDTVGQLDPRQAARASYAMADALLAERAKPQPAG